VSRARRKKRARRAPAQRTAPRSRTTRGRTPTPPSSVAYRQVTGDDAKERIAQALKLLARAGAFDA
jgi:hypothetical protein